MVFRRVVVVCEVAVRVEVGVEHVLHRLRDRANQVAPYSLQWASHCESHLAALPTRGCTIGEVAVLAKNLHLS